MPDKDFEDLKKDITKEIRALAQKTDKACEDAKKLRKEQADLDCKQAPSDDDKKRVFDVRKSLKALEDSYSKQADDASARINRILKTSVPDDQKKLPEWQKGMDKWYRDMIEKEAGLDVGKDLKVTGDISIKNKEANIYLKGKF